MRIASVLLAAVATAAQAQPSKAIPVTVDNFIRAESDLYLGNFVKESGGVGKFNHRREVASIDNQTVIRLNRDTLYSAAVFDLDAGPVTVTLPDAGKRFMSLMAVNQDHYVPVVIYRGSHTFTRKEMGTRYFAAAVRTLVDPNDPQDLNKVHALQDAIKVSQKGTGKFEVPAWDPVSQKKVRDALLVLAEAKEGFKGAFGKKGQVDPVARLIGAAAGWGGNPDKDATYLGAAPAKNDGTTIHRVTVPKDVPVDAFWSISVYNAQGYYEKNALNAYTINSITGKNGADGSTTVQFGGCDGRVPNCIPIVKGWNYTVRLYRPRQEILDGKWKFPEAKPL